MQLRTHKNQPSLCIQHIPSITRYTKYKLTSHDVSNQRDTLATFFLHNCIYINRYLNEIKIKNKRREGRHSAFIATLASYPQQLDMESVWCGYQQWIILGKCIQQFVYKCEVLVLHRDSFTWCDFSKSSC